MTFWVAGAALVGTIGGAALSANAAGDAADTQAAGADRATAAQERQFNKQIELQEPWRQAGMAGLNQLLQYTGVTTPQQAQAQAQQSSQIFDEAAYLAANPDVAAEVAQGKIASGKAHYDQWGRNEGRPAPFTTTPAPGQAAPLVAPTIPSDKFGSLLKPFTAADFQADPGYGFVQQQGEQGLARAAQAGRGVGSGKYLKDAMRFNTGLASQEYSKSYDRFRNNQTDIFNRLASVAGIGQTATNAQTAAAGTFGANAASNILGGANALAAGQVGGANAINQGVGQGISLYQTNRMLDLYGANRGVTPPNPSYGGSTTYQPSPMGDWYSTSNLA